MVPEIFVVNRVYAKKISHEYPIFVKNYAKCTQNVTMRGLYSKTNRKYPVFRKKRGIFIHFFYIDPKTHRFELPLTKNGSFSCDFFL